MNKTRIAVAVVVIAAIGGGLWYYQRSQASAAPSFRFTAIERTSVEATVSATGALSAVRTVQVGTQVSGQVSALYVDFNAKVKKGQLLARIDPILQQQAVSAAQAALARVEAQAAQATAEFERNKPLLDAKIVTASDFTTIQANYDVAKQNVRSAQIDLDKARQNLAYTSIYAPIDGVIVSRSVDVGQTVAASLATPELFRIAENLSEMQILASVDESDIGKIAVGQAVTFTVAAYAGRTFPGSVQQVRLQSVTTDNVVNYTVVIVVSNTDGKLLPGMTATVKFLTSAAPNVLAVANAALRFTPTAAMLGADSAILTARRDSVMKAMAASGPPPGARPGADPFGPPGAGGPPRPKRPMSDSSGVLWTVDAKGKFTPHRVRTGITDGQKTQVTGKDIDVGMQVVVGISIGSPAGAATTNPFQQTQQRGGPGGGRPPGGF